MDSRLQLTDEQKKLVEQLKETIEKMREAKVGILADDDTNLFFFNEEHVSDWTWQENFCEGDYEMQIDPLPCVQVGSIRVFTEDEALCIMFKD